MVASATNADIPMNIEQTIANLSALSVDERLRIVQKLWDSIPPESEVTVSAEQREELQRRVAAHDRDPDSAISRDELERRLKESK
jgi:putative addiction module component (TIGR02574 family)